MNFVSWTSSSDRGPKQIDFAASAPAAPDGFEWKRNESDGIWALSAVAAVAVAVETPSSKLAAEDIQEHTHEVCSDDTLTSVSIRYGCNAGVIKRLNPGISSNQIQHLKSIRLPGSAPLKPSTLTEEQKKAQKRDELIAAFREATGEGLEEAIFYLEDASMHLEPALANWEKHEELSLK